jgi:hypothetical protein
MALTGVSNPPSGDCWVSVVKTFGWNRYVGNTVFCIRLGDAPKEGTTLQLKNGSESIEATMKSVVQTALPRLATEPLLCDLVRSSNDAVIGKATDGMVVCWDEAAACPYGYMADEMMGREISVPIPPDRPLESSNLLARVQAKQQVVVRSRLRAGFSLGPGGAHDRFFQQSSINLTMSSS